MYKYVDSSALKIVFNLAYCFPIYLLSKKIDSYQ